MTAEVVPVHAMAKFLMEKRYVETGLRVDLPAAVALRQVPVGSVGVVPGRGAGEKNVAEGLGTDVWEYIQQQRRKGHLSAPGVGPRLRLQDEPWPCGRPSCRRGPLAPPPAHTSP